MTREIKEPSMPLEKIKENPLTKLQALVKVHYKASPTVIGINYKAT